MSRLTAGGIAMAALILTADQASKLWILHGLDLPDRGSIALLPFLNFTMVWNHGVTFGLLTSRGPAAPYILGAVALAVVVGLFVWLRRATTWLTALPIGAIAGGAVGNVVDRLYYGAVVDFIHAHAWSYSWYVFNLADAAIVCGVAVLMLEAVLPKQADQQQGQGAPPPGPPLGAEPPDPRP